MWIYENISQTWIFRSVFSRTFFDDKLDFLDLFYDIPDPQTDYLWRLKSWISEKLQNILSRIFRFTNFWKHFSGSFSRATKVEFCSYRINLYSWNIFWRGFQDFYYISFQGSSLAPNEGFSEYFSKDFPEPKNMNFKDIFFNDQKWEFLIYFYKTFRATSLDFWGIFFFKDFQVWNRRPFKKRGFFKNIFKHFPKQQTDIFKMFS